MHKTTTDVNIVAEVTKEALEDTDEPTNLEPDQLRIGIPQEPKHLRIFLGTYHFGDSQKPLSFFVHFTTSIAG